MDDVDLAHIAGRNHNIEVLNSDEDGQKTQGKDRVEGKCRSVDDKAETSWNAGACFPGDE